MISREELSRVTDQKATEKLREALERKRKADEERHQFHETFGSRKLHPDVSAPGVPVRPER